MSGFRMMRSRWLITWRLSCSCDLSKESVFNFWIFLDINFFKFLWISNFEMALAKHLDQLRWKLFIGILVTFGIFEKSNAIYWLNRRTFISNREEPSGNLSKLHGNASKSFQIFSKTNGNLLQIFGLFQKESRRSPKASGSAAIRVKKTVTNFSTFQSQKSWSHFRYPDCSLVFFSPVSVRVNFTQTKRYLSARESRRLVEFAQLNWFLIISSCFCSSTHTSFQIEITTVIETRDNRF